MSDNDIQLAAHLMRRAGFGASRDELEVLAARDYEAVVEDLLHPERFPEIEEDIFERYHGRSEDNPGTLAALWMYRMINSQRPLEEKVALLWHQVFATANSKLEHASSMEHQINGFRRHGLGDVRTLLIELSKTPAMIYWLDNNENRKGEPNENYGRELLELFSMGVGNYSEEDIKNAARAFTGWSFTQPIPVYPQGRYPSEFVYRDESHDDSVKTFLGETGRFNGEDIIDIIVKQRATARFISRHMYNFFVADEPQVPAWNELAPQDPDAIDMMVDAYFESGGSIRSMLRVMFNSDFFKEARFKRVKSPTELVVGVAKLVGTYQGPDQGLESYVSATTVMGQQLLYPPTVEGWHTGREWIDGGTLNERVNFAVNEVDDVAKPGVERIVEAMASGGATLSPEEFIERALDLAGPLPVGEKTRGTLSRFATSGGTLDFSTEEQREQSVSRVIQMLQLIVASQEYQFA